MTQRPLVYYWIAQYSNGTALPQYDPYTFRENSFGEIQQDKLIKFGLYPFPRNLVDGIRKKNNDSVVSIPFLPIYEINLNKNKRLIHYRDVFISQETYHRCGKCNKEFSYSPKTSKSLDSVLSSPICPHCGAHDLYICKSCKKIYQRFEDAKRGMCECGSHLNKEVVTSRQYNKERRWIYYYLGYQTLINGINHKVLMRIQENGDSLIL